jgi:endogenous inhibitor of DNA gyrase (YacG/DUF329 family)
MGEIADAMLDGTLCEGCGTYMDGESPGIPRYCSAQCAKDRGADFSEIDRYQPRIARFDRSKIKPSPLRPGKVECPVCKKRVKAAGLADHQRDVHG